MSRVLVRLRRDLVDEIRADLARPHPFAFERVGFLYGRTAMLDRSGVVVLVREFKPVPDGDYVRHRGHGATIGTAAIRRALASALETGDSVLHVHEHVGRAVPSGTDRKTYRELTPTYVAAAPAAAHGGLILGSESAYCVLWPPGGRMLVSASVRVVGFSLAFWETSDGL